jgi:hypothetical protein
VNIVTLCPLQILQLGGPRPEQERRAFWQFAGTEGYDLSSVYADETNDETECDECCE